MDKKFHDPSEYIRGIQQILISDKKKIGFLFGAGSSMARKNKSSLTVPAIEMMTTQIISELVGEDNSLSGVFKEIKENEIEKGKFHIESILTNLEQKIEIIGNGKLNGFKKDEIENLVLNLKIKIRDKVSVHKNDREILKGVEKHLVQSDFSEWIGQAARKYGIEIFTTNYDFLFEMGLEFHDIPYQTKLWKVHGSLGWHHDKETNKV